MADSLGSLGKGTCYNFKHLKLKQGKQCLQETWVLLSRAVSVSEPNPGSRIAVAGAARSLTLRDLDRRLLYLGGTLAAEPGWGVGCEKLLQLLSSAYSTVCSPSDSIYSSGTRTLPEDTGLQTPPPGTQGISYFTVFLHGLESEAA